MAERLNCRTNPDIVCGLRATGICSLHAEICYITEHGGPNERRLAISKAKRYSVFCERAQILQRAIRLAGVMSQLENLSDDVLSELINAHPLGEETTLNLCIDNGWIECTHNIDGRCLLENMLIYLADHGSIGDLDMMIPMCQAFRPSCIKSLQEDFLKLAQKRLDELRMQRDKLPHQAILD